MQLDHINVVTEDLDATVSFFADVIGIHDGHRPNFGRAGSWMYGEKDGPAIVHIVVSKPDTGGTGPLDHVAFRGQDLDALTVRLDAHEIKFDARTVPGTGDRQIFFNAPFGLKIEVNFPPKAG